MTTPPTIPGARPGKIYPTPTSRIGRAWAHAWAELSTLPADTTLDGTQLAERVAKKVAPRLAPVTMTQLFARMGRAGVLVEEKRPTAGSRGIRARSFYRIPTATDRALGE